MTYFLLSSATCLAAFFGIYSWLLRRETFFHLNRIYLLTAAVASLLIPVFKIEVFKDETAEVADFQSLSQILEQAQSAPRAVELGLDTPVAEQFSVSLGEAFFYFYLAVAAVLATFFIIKISRLLLLIRRCRRQKIEGYTLADLPGKPMPPASFFHYIFWEKGMSADTAKQFIFQHEVAHVRGWHSVDVVLAELLVIFQWFNPMAWAFCRNLRAVHEYIADDWVVRNTQRRLDYAMLLARSAGFRPAPPLANSFDSQLKNRLIMLAKAPSRPLFRAKYLLALPLTAALMLLFSFRLIEKIDLPKSLETALEATKNFTEKIAQTPVFQKVSNKKQQPNMPAVAALPTPYIFYWGQIQARIFQIENTENFFGEVKLAGLNFVQSIDREPRLWNGHSLENVVSFRLTDDLGSPDVAVRSDYRDSKIYFPTRKILNEKFPRVAGGSQFEIYELALPNGKTARIALLFVPETDQPIEAKREQQWNDMTAAERENLFGNRPMAYLWGKHIDSRNLTRIFFTADEFWETAATAPHYLLADGTDVDSAVGSLGILIPEIDPTEHFFNSPEQYQNIVQRIRGTVLPPGTTIFLDFKNFPKKEKTSGSKVSTGALMKIVADHSPLLNLRTTDRHTFFFRLGSFFRGWEAYGRSFPAENGERQYADGSSHFDFYELTTGELSQMLELQPQLWRGAELLGVPTFSIKFGDLEADSQPGIGFSKDFVAAVRKKLQFADSKEPLVVSGIQLGDWDLSRTKINFFPQLELPKTALLADSRRTVLESAQAATLLSVLPNPAAAGSSVEVVFDLPSAAAVQIFVYDEQLRQVFMQAKDCPAGRSAHTISMANSGDRGMFVCVLKTPFGETQQRFLVQ